MAKKELYIKRIERGDKEAHWPHKKQETRSATLAVIRKGKIETPVTIKWFMGKSPSATQVSCSVWINGEMGGFSTSGGYGYDKELDSFHNAMEEAGYKTTTKSGGHCQVEGVLLEFARFLGYRGDAAVI